MLYACNQTLALIGLSHIACAVLLRAHMKKFSINRAFIIFSHFGADWIQIGKARTDERLCWSLDNTTFDAEGHGEQSKIRPA